MDEPGSRPKRRLTGDTRLRMFLVLGLLCIALTGLYVRLRVREVSRADGLARASVSAGSLDEILSAPYVVFLDTADGVHRHLAVAPLAAPESARFVAEKSCERVYFAGGTGLCLGVTGTVAYAYDAQAFDARLRSATHVYEIRGIPSRARISRDGRRGSVTVFVHGDSYGAPFSTRTALFDLQSEATLGTLEEFTVYKDGQVLQSPDFNFWGTSFADDGDRFFATLGTGVVPGTTFLVEGRVATREMKVLRDNVECPSLSPDGRRIAFKKRISPAPQWRVAVLDLATSSEVVLNETRNVDDQVEWLDDAHVLYALSKVRDGGGLATDVWVASIDGSAPPHVFLSNALSPAVVRAPPR